MYDNKDGFRCTNDANLGHLGGFHSNSGECRVWAKLVPVIHEIVYLANINSWKKLCSCVAWTVFYNMKKNSFVVYYYVQLSDVKLNSAFTTWNNQQQ